MELHTVLIMLSLLPLLEAQNPEHAINIGDPITNETLSWLSGKWFLIAVADSDPDYRQEIQKVQTIFFYLTLNLINDTMELREYHTKDDHCVYNSNLLGFQRENGTLFKYGEARRPDIPPELREVFQKAVTHVGMDESEIIFVDWKKDRCSEQEKKHLELEKETKKDPEESQA
ncbi:alpha-1-acid glycoprotein 3 isoform X4 [Mus musculus]|uniref:alpha-1-acid glycoprotein 3 isoform X4 n=1 Tax=Mus musculus TaxID=10090 RepID=UPI001671BA8F|nr:alpha-1-acid glycoprotein 3 isoform X4 [Mus musculus]